MVVEYENVTDTIKRRLESPVNTPETEKSFEPKKSKIPIALKSPSPIRKEIIQGGNKSRTSSLERGKRKAPDSPMTDSVTSIKSNDSTSGISTSRSSIPTSPDTPKKESSTFNLLKDSELFTQISKHKASPKPAARQNKKMKQDPCHVVAIKEHEILKSTVAPIEPMEIDISEAVETVVTFIPQTVETVEILDDTETESFYGSDTDERANKDKEKRPSVDFGTEPKTFVVERKTFDQRMRPTLGIIINKHSKNDDEIKSLKAIIGNAPDIIQSANKEPTDGSLGTPPPTPCEEGEVECPLLYDLAMRRDGAKRSLREDDTNEYLILDAVPKDQADLPEQSVTDEVFEDVKLVELRKQQIIDSVNKPVKKSPISITGTPERVRKLSSTSVTEEDIYSEVDEIPAQVVFYF